MLNELLLNEWLLRPTVNFGIMKTCSVTAVTSRTEQRTASEGANGLSNVSYRAILACVKGANVS